MGKIVTFTINGTRKQEYVEANTLLMNLIRDRLHLTGTKYACGIGECGACTILMNGNPVLSCLTLAVDADGMNLVTIEGLNDEVANALRESFLEEGAVQCGYCTPGFLISSWYLLKKNPAPTEMEIKQAIKGNLCRCTGYVGIIRGISKAAEKLQSRTILPQVAAT
jgi:carbon-monoxide dehydrogenase small subunit